MNQIKLMVILSFLLVGGSTAMGIAEQKYYRESETKALTDMEQRQERDGNQADTRRMRGELKTATFAMG